MRGAGSLILAGGPGPGLPGFGALAGWAAFARMFRNPGERFDAGAGCCHEPPAVSRAQLGSAEHSLITATLPRLRQLCRRAASSRAPRLAAGRRPAHRLKRRCTRHASGRCSRAACSLQPLVGSRVSPTHLCHRAACHHRWHPCPLWQSHADHPVTHARVCGKPARENSAIWRVGALLFAGGSWRPVT